jgi:octanoyl-[GcvH]:protein N-octanoyltransferase
MSDLLNLNVSYVTCAITHHSLYSLKEVTDKVFSDQDAPKFTLVDSSQVPLVNDILFPYAWDEWLCRQVAADSPSFLHIWQHPKAFVLGLRDRQLPYIEQAIEWLESDGYAVAVRNSGGAAVPLDYGVVNISLIAPKPYRSLNFRDDFETMIELIRHSLASWTTSIEVGEISGGYCPGDYDLSVNGLKFCGLAQRRQAKGFVVQAFVNVEGSGSNRARLVQTFYEIASNGEPSVAYPAIEAAKTSTLQELVGIPSTPAFIQSIKNLNSVSTAESQNSVQFNNKLFPLDEIKQTMNHLKKRYAIVQT